MARTWTYVPKHDLQQMDIIVEHPDQSQVTCREFHLGTRNVLADVCRGLQRGLLEVGLLGHILVHCFHQLPWGAKDGNPFGASRVGFVPV